MKYLQTNLFKPIEELRVQPLVIAYGLGVDSTAVLVEFHKRGIRPDAILFADTGDEKQETYDYLPIISQWLVSVDFPPVTIVKYIPQDFKGLPSYATLGENCLSNGTLPSLAFGFKSCSLKWKVVPQNKWVDRWPLALDYWKSGGKVLKVIGYDASPKDLKRYAHAKGVEDPKYDYWYPLVEWKMDREACKASIRNAGLPVPPKSACKFCPATRPEELHTHRKAYLRYIVMLEERAKPKLEGCMDADQLLQDFRRKHVIWESKLRNATGKRLARLRLKEPLLKKVGNGCAGLWRSATKKRPAMMTDYIIAHKLLPIDEVADIQKMSAALSVDEKISLLDTRNYLNWHDFLEMFSEEDALLETGHACLHCSL